MSGKLLKCPFCECMVGDSNFCPHIVQRHSEMQGRVRGSYVRWLDSLRMEAGGDWRRGLGQGDGMGQYSRSISKAEAGK